jgi:hypothetical protein
MHQRGQQHHLHGRERLRDGDSTKARVFHPGEDLRIGVLALPLPPPPDDAHV